MTELMKRYEGERVERDVIKYFEDMSPKQQVVRAFYVHCLFQEFKKLEAINKWLESQLTWRPVSEKPEKDDWVTLRRNVNGKTDDEQVWFYHLMDVKEWEWLVKTLGATHWLPIPPAPEGEIK
jgi:hypothetical protein